LRPAGGADADLLLRWRNDPDAVRFSVSGRAVTVEEHCAWMAARLADTATRLWIAQEGGAPVGQVRLDVSDGTATVSIAVAPEHRGAGLGSEMLRALLSLIAGDSAVLRLRALANPDNAASLRIFQKAGFRPLPGGEGGFAVLERSVGR
jgi:RimJ/RimL family protein N-acetyltransferase